MHSSRNPSKHILALVALLALTPITYAVDSLAKDILDSVNAVPAQKQVVAPAVVVSAPEKPEMGSSVLAALPVPATQVIIGGEKPVEKLQATGDLVVWGEYALTDKEAPKSGVNWKTSYLVDVPWYTDINIGEKEQLKTVRSKLVQDFGVPSFDNGVEVWKTDNFSYQLGQAATLHESYPARVFAGLEKDGKIAAFKDGWVLRINSVDTDANIQVVNRINTGRISNAGMAVKAPSAKQTPQASAKGTPTKSLKDGLTPGPHTGCPPGKVWVAPYTNEKGQLVQGKCVDQAKVPGPTTATTPPGAQKAPGVPANTKK
jgi:hypothetical protein